jgi:hypothetical protein
MGVLGVLVLAAALWFGIPYIPVNSQHGFDG